MPLAFRMARRVAYVSILASVIVVLAVNSAGVERRTK